MKFIRESRRWRHGASLMAGLASLFLAGSAGLPRAAELSEHVRRIELSRDEGSSTGETAARRSREPSLDSPLRDPGAVDISSRDGETPGVPRTWEPSPELMASHEVGAEVSKRHLRRAAAHREAGQLERAVAELRLAIVADPTSEHAANAAAMAKDILARSRAALEPPLGPGPEMALGFERLATTLSEEDDVPLVERLAALSQERSCLAERALILAAWGRIEADSGRHEAALPLYAQAAELAGGSKVPGDGDLEARVRLEAARSSRLLGELDLARRVLLDLAERFTAHPLASAARLEVATIALHVLDYSAAAEALEALLGDEHPWIDPAEVTSLLGWSKLRLGRHESALELFSQAIERASASSPADRGAITEAEYWAARTLSLSGRSEEAVSALSRIAARRDASYHGHLAAGLLRELGAETDARDREENEVRAVSWLPYAIARDGHDTTECRAAREAARSLDLAARMKLDDGASRAAAIFGALAGEVECPALGTAMRLGQLMRRRGGSEIVALVEYSAGIAAVLRWQERSGEVPDDVFLEEVPCEETRQFVRRALGSAHDLTLRCGELVEKHEIG